MYVDSCFLSMVLVGACMVLVLYTYDVGLIQVLFYQKKNLREAGTHRGVVSQPLSLLSLQRFRSWLR